MIQLFFICFYSDRNLDGIDISATHFYHALHDFLDGTNPVGKATFYERIVSYCDINQNLVATLRDV